MTRAEISAALKDGTLDQIRQHGVCIVCGADYAGGGKVRVCCVKCKRVVESCRCQLRKEGKLQKASSAECTPRKLKEPPRALIRVSLDTDDPWKVNYGGGWVNADPVLGF